MRYAEKVILAKTEASYGIDAVPTGAANAILTRDFEMRAVEAERRSRELDRPNLGAPPESVTQLRRVVSFRVELAGAGGAGTVAKYGPLLTACAFDETVNATVDVQYDPNSQDGDSVTLYFNLDGTDYNLIGARGAVGFEFASGSYPYLAFTFTGLLVPAADGAAPVPDYSGFQKPLEVNNINTPTFTVHGYAATLQALNVERGQQVVYRNWVGQEAVRVTDRRYSGRATILQPTIAQWDYEAAVRNETLAALQLVHGSAAGTVVQLDAAKVQVLDYSLGEDQGDAVLALDLLLTAGDPGDDDIKLTVK